MTKKRKETRAVIIHHTGGGTLKGALAALKAGNKGANAIIDRDGTIYELTDLDEVAAHTRPSKAYGNYAVRAPGLNSANTYGIEVVATGNDDVTPAQIAVGTEFAEKIAKSYGLDPMTAIVGHGEVTPTHRQLVEGMAIVSNIRTGTPITMGEAQFEKMYGPNAWAKGEFFGPGGTMMAGPAPVSQSSIGTRTLKKGMVGNDVQAVQSFLAKNGFYSGNIDGKFGPQTRDALKSYQGAVGLSDVDGVVGKETRAAIQIGIDAAPKPDYADPLGVQGFQERRALLQGSQFDEPMPSSIGQTFDVPTRSMRPTFDVPTRALTSPATIGDTARMAQHQAMQEAIQQGWSAKGAAVRSGMLQEAPTPRPNPAFQNTIGANSPFADPNVNSVSSRRMPDFDAVVGNPADAAAPPASQLGRAPKKDLLRDTFDIMDYSGNDAVSAPASKQAPGGTIGSSARSSLPGATFDGWSVGPSFDASNIGDLAKMASGSNTGRPSYYSDLEAHATAAGIDYRNELAAEAAKTALPAAAGTGGGVMGTPTGYGGFGSPQAQQAAVGQFQTTGKTAGPAPATIGAAAQQAISARPVQTTSIPTPVRTVAPPTASASVPIPRANPLIAPKFTAPPIEVPAYKVSSAFPLDAPPALSPPATIGQTAPVVAPTAPRKPFFPKVPLAAKMALGVLAPGLSTALSVMSGLGKIMDAGWDDNVAAGNAAIARGVQASDMIGGAYGGASYGRRQSDGSVTGTTSSGTGYRSSVNESTGRREYSVGGRTYGTDSKGRSTQIF